jgi:TPR repeat protein
MFVVAGEDVAMRLVLPLLVVGALGCERGQTATPETKPSESRPPAPTAATATARSDDDLLREMIGDGGSKAASAGVAGGGSAIAAPGATRDENVAKCKTRDTAGCSAACEQGDLPSCVTSADLSLKDSDKETKKGCETPLRKACDGNVGRACSMLASRCIPAVQGFKSTEQGKAERAALNEKACSLDDGLGCFNISKNYEEGYGVAQDDAKAASLMSKALKLMPKACDGGDAASCLSLAMLYDPESKSKRVPKDANKAKALYKKACDGGEQIGCRNAAGSAK